VPISLDTRWWAGSCGSEFMERLRQLFAAMDEAYTQAADRSGFRCQGCPENCCETRFHHHTLIEYTYLLAGVQTLPERTRAEVLEDARRVNERMRLADAAGESLRLMCPLNRDQRCLVYPFRPMICRLHGIPHELRQADGRILAGQGCGHFDRVAGNNPGRPLDRTLFYRHMALLERQAREAAGSTGRIRMTIAEMLVAGSRPERDTFSR
jgi:Fe-S-cluster containining protein